ncbi:MAG TPA: hypothetical protein ENH38_09145 [Nitrospirae bacterium]|nr:hypothetical protein [Nitrospirota bacterium]HDZ88763.1 hypothetical protein [Nitrospirota bacterium]
MKKRLYFLITGIIFGLVSLFHLIRLLFWWPVRIGTWDVPVRISVFGFIAALGLSIWGFWLAKKRKE